MMQPQPQSQFYVCKKVGMYGVPLGSVERYAHAKAAVLEADGFIEPFDRTNKQHLKAPNANAAIATVLAQETEKAKPDRALVAELAAWLAADRAACVARVEAAQAARLAAVDAEKKSRKA